MILLNKYIREILISESSNNIAYDEYYKLWKSIVEEGEYLAWDAPTPAKEFSKQTGLKFLGSGYSRAVFALSSGEVLKLALDSKGIEDNKNECSIWQNTSSQFRRWLAPIYDCAENGGWLIMQRVSPLSDEEWKEIEGSSEVEDALRIIGIEDAGSKEQWGMFRHPVLIDYGAKVEEWDY